MKVAFDEHIPPTMVKVFQTFATDMLVKQIKTATPGSFWHIPAMWPKTENAKLRSISNRDLKMEKIERQKADQPRIRAERAAKRKAAEADDLFTAADRRERNQNGAAKTG